MPGLVVVGTKAGPRGDRQEGVDSRRSLRTTASRATTPSLREGRTRERPGRAMRAQLSGIAFASGPLTDPERPTPVGRVMRWWKGTRSLIVARDFAAPANSASPSSFSVQTPFIPGIHHLSITPTSVGAVLSFGAACLAAIESFPLTMALPFILHPTNNTPRI